MPLNRSDVSGTGEGFELTAPADTDARTLILYLGGWKASANLEVSLSDASAQPIVINLSDLTGAFDRRVAVNYTAGRGNERLVLRYVMTGGPGNVTLQAAAMQGGGPLRNLPPVLDPIGDQTVLENQTLAFGVSARDDDGPAPLSLSASGLPPGASFSDLGGGNGQFTWTPGESDVSAVPYQIKFSAVDASLAEDSETIEIAVSPTGGGGGSLVGAITSPSGTADLSAEGSVDWVKWAYLDVSGLHRKSGVTPLINDYRPLGKVPNRFASSGRLAYAWIDGTPTLAASTRDGLYVRGIGEGFEISVSADTTPRTLIVYLGGWRSVGQLEASLSDASAPPWVTSMSDLSDVYDRRVELTFRASAPGNLLTLRYTMTGGTGNVTLQAAALNSVVP